MSIAAAILAERRGRDERSPGMLREGAEQASSSMQAPIDVAFVAFPAELGVPKARLGLEGLKRGKRQA